VKAEAQRGDATAARGHTILKVVLVAGLATAVVLLMVKFRRAGEVVSETVEDIEAEFASLDPIERAAVVARLAKDTVRDVRAKRV
jgi:hypothetical protein